MTVRALLSAWDRWWMRQVPPHALAVLRIGFGVFLLYIWGLKIPHVPILFSTRGLVLPLVATLPVPGPGLAWAIFFIFYSCLFLFTIGAAMRSAGLLAFVINLYYWFLSLHLFNTSFDRLFLFLLLVLALSGADRALSWRAARRGGIRSWESASILPQRLIAVQITAVYLGVGLQKLWLPDWQSGDVLTYSLMSVWGTPLAIALLRLHLPMAFYDALLFVIKFFEVTIPAGLWIRVTRTWFMLGGLVFHLSIALLLNIWWFLILVPAYIVFFDPEEIRSSVERIVRRT